MQSINTGKTRRFWRRAAHLSKLVAADLLLFEYLVKSLFDTDGEILEEAGSLRSETRFGIAQRSRRTSITAVARDRQSVFASCEPLSKVKRSVPSLDRQRIDGDAGGCVSAFALRHARYAARRSRSVRARRPSPGARARIRRRVIAAARR